MHHRSTAAAPGLRGRLLAAFAAVLAVLAVAAVPANAGSVTPLERKAVDRAYGELVEGVKEPSSNNNTLLPSGQPYDIGAPWCGSFLNWVMKQAGVDPQGGGRGTWNVNVAKAWSIYGPKNGGYGRNSTAYDARPGDLLVFGYDGTASTGGHVTMVVATTSDRKVVWTIGGNEGNAVRLQKRTLGGSGMYLVTLHEFRNRKADIWGDSPSGNPMDFGDVFYTRSTNSMGSPTVKVTKIVHNGVTYQGSTLTGSGFKGVTNVSSSHSVDWTFVTQSYSYVNVAKTNATAGIATGETNIDFGRASTSSGTT